MNRLTSANHQSIRILTCVLDRCLKQVDNDEDNEKSQPKTEFKAARNVQA